MSLIVALLAAAAAAASPQPLQPSGKWIVDYADNACALQRAFGTGDAQVMVALRPAPIGAAFDILIHRAKGDGEPSRRGAVTMRLSASDAPIETEYLSGNLANDGGRLTSFTVNWADLGALPASKLVTIEVGEEMSIAIAPTQTASALAALETCQQDLRQSLGINPAALEAIAKPAEAVDPQAYILTDRDYPKLALNWRFQGTSSILWTIGVDGRVSECKVLQSSGHELLDKTACDAISKRGRYRPALDQSGNPVVSWGSRRIRWQLP